MANNLKRIYVGAICNRDLEVLDKIKKLLLKNYNISIINLLKKESYSFDLEYFKKRIKKYPISFLILKLTTQKPNEKIYEAIIRYMPNIPILNSIKSVKTCESRHQTFKLIKEKCKNLKIPRTFFTIPDAIQACNNGINIIIKLDKHNIPDLPKNDRIIGIAHSTNELLDFIKDYDSFL